MDDPGYRVERDTMGEVRVPADAKYAAQTQRAVENFTVSGEPVDPRLIRALALIKGHAARVNAGLPEVPAVTDEMAPAVEAAAREVAEGRWGDQFPVDVFQTGSGTSSNMNVNEVIATLANERLSGDPALTEGSAVANGPVTANDVVNASQSSNDVFPSAVHLATAEALRDDLVPAARHLQTALAAKADEFAAVVKSGRTHLMDATPVTLGQEFGGYASQVEQAADGVAGVVERVSELPLGGTAVGTGINAPASFAPAVVAALAAETGLPLVEARDHFAAQGARDALVAASGEMRVLAVALVKIANDLRWMASGPSTGLAEIRLPDLQPGSSIMPGKVNPVIPEVVTQVAAQVIGNDAAVAFGATQGAFELNVYMPMMARNLLESARLLTAACRDLADRCVAGIEADAERCRRYAESSPAVATALNPHIGYERAAEVIERAHREGRTILDVVVSEGLLDEEEAAAVLDVEAMTRGGVVE